MTITAGAGVASLTHPRLGKDSLPVYLLCLPLAGFALMQSRLGYRGSRKRKLIGFLVGGCMFTALILQTACGGESTSGGLKAQNYTVTVTGMSGSTEHTTTVSISVR
jgi:hypothetical protein